MRAELQRYPISYAVLLLSLTPFLLLLSGGLGAVSELLMPPRATHLAVHEYGRLWGASLVHFSVGHIASNFLVWYLLARSVEAKSRAALLVLCVLVPVLSNYAEWFMKGAEFGGLSGLVYGLLGFGLVLNKLNSADAPEFDPIIPALMLLALPVAATGWFGDYANYAHFVGLLVGALIGLLFYLMRLKKL